MDADNEAQELGAPALEVLAQAPKANGPARSSTGAMSSSPRYG
jgi:hypothetical protein